MVHQLRELVTIATKFALRYLPTKVTRRETPSSLFLIAGEDARAENYTPKHPYQGQRLSRQD